MAKAFKPMVMYRDNNGSNVSLTIKTYAEVKRKMNAFMNDSVNDCVSVYRHRRGEWGEWFEHWEKQGNKNVIVKQGWQ